MHPVENRHNCKRKGNIETGMAFIVVGAVFMAMKLELIQAEWRWYMFTALVFIVIGLVELVQLHKPHKVFAGLSKIALGAWFYVAFSGLWGITPANSWPLVLIAVGAGMVLKSLLKTGAGDHSDNSFSAASHNSAPHNSAAHNRVPHNDSPNE